MRHRYGLEPEDYEKMFEVQNNKCASCGKEGGEVKGKKLVVDHDHSTGKVRELLCNRCNFVAGALEDPECWLAYKYLLRHNSNALARLELLLREKEPEKAGPVPGMYEKYDPTTKATF